MKIGCRIIASEQPEQPTMYTIMKWGIVFPVPTVAQVYCNTTRRASSQPDISPWYIFLRGCSEVEGRRALIRVQHASTKLGDTTCCPSASEGKSSVSFLIDSLDRASGESRARFLCLKAFLVLHSVVHIRKIKTKLEEGVRNPPTFAPTYTWPIATGSRHDCRF